MAGLLPSKTIARYVGVMFLTRVVAVLVALVGILLTLDLIGEAGRILAVPGNSNADVWTYTTLRAPQLIAQFLPFSVLLATLATLGGLNAHSEVVSMKAAGISAHQILAPLFVVAIGVAGVSFVFNETLLTRTNATLERWKAADYAPLRTLGAGPTEVWARDGFDLMHAARKEGSGAAARLTDFILFSRQDTTRLTGITSARVAVPAPGGWTLIDARRFDVASGRSVNRARDFWPSHVGPERFIGVEPDPSTIPFWKLRPKIRAAHADGKATGALASAWWHKLAAPLSALMMPLLGAVAGFGMARSGKLFVRAVAGMFLGFAFFVADNFMLAMGDFGAAPPLVAAWAPVVIFLLIGESVLLRTEE
jgi:lipopolysaccharide export system permease protein